MSDFLHHEAWFLPGDEGWEEGAEMERFDALCRQCCVVAQRLLWREEPEMILAEARYQLLLLLLEFDGARGVPLEAFLVKMLPQRTLNWAQKERQRWKREKQVEWGEDGTVTERSHARLHDGCHATSATETNSDAAAWWQEACALLTVRQRRVMEATLQGHTEREIAAQLGVSCAAVHGIKMLAQKKLRDEWEKADK